jgi:hypothetical protein
MLNVYEANVMPFVLGVLGVIGGCQYNF